MTQQQKVTFFTGAGLSAESGVRTFRENGGLWNEYDVDVICNYTTLERNIDEVFKFYNRRRADLAKVEPNTAHLAIAQLQQEFGADRARIITQNVDDLLERANCLQVLHVHGELTKMMCRQCDHVWKVGYQPVPVDTCCPACGIDRTKPDVVLFMEPAPRYAILYEWLNQINDGDLLVVIGTSGNVIPINAIIQSIASSAETLICNLEPESEINSALFTHLHFGKVTEQIEEISAICRKVLNRG
jgi:NAD-dependent deacetylase